MTDQSTPPVSAPRHNRRMIVLTGVLVLQVLCAVFFLGDVIEDFRMGGLVPHTLFEGAVALVLFLGVVFCGHEVKRTIERSRDLPSITSRTSRSLPSSRLSETVSPENSESARSSGRATSRMPSVDGTRFPSRKTLSDMQ